MSEAEIAGLKKQIPPGRRGAPGEIVRVPRFGRGAFEVGSECVIDGGRRTLLTVTQDVLLFVLEEHERAAQHTDERLPGQHGDHRMLAAGSLRSGQDEAEDVSKRSGSAIAWFMVASAAAIYVAIGKRPATVSTASASGAPTAVR